MAILDSIVAAAGEAILYIVSAISGRAFTSAPEKAQRLGEYFLMAIAAIALIAVTVIYS